MSLRGSKNIYVSKGLVQLFEIIKLLVLANLILPEDFGLFSVGFAIIAGLDVITQTGIVSAMINSDKNTEYYADQVFTFNILRSSLLGICLFMASDLCAHLLNIGELANLLKYLSVSVVLQGMLNPYLVKLQREFAYSLQMRYDLIVGLSSSIFTICLAYRLPTYESLVFGNIFYWFLRVTLSFIFVKELPRVVLSIRRIMELFTFGKWVWLQTITLYATQQFDKIYLSNFLSLNELGWYHMAHRIVSIPISQISLTTVQVLFPVYSRLKNEVEHVMILFNEASRLILALTIPSLIFLSLNSEELLEIFLGIEWSKASVALAILSVYAIFKILGDTFTPLMSGLGYPYVDAWRNLSQSAVFVVGVLLLGQSITLISVCYVVIASSLIGFLSSLALSSLTLKGRLRVKFPFFHWIFSSLIFITIILILRTMVASVLFEAILLVIILLTYFLKNKPKLNAFI